MEERININVSSTEYDNTSKEIKKTLALVEEMVHGQDDFLTVSYTHLTLPTIYSV